MTDENLIDNYRLTVEGMTLDVQITKVPGQYVPKYSVKIPGLAEGTKIILDTKIKGELVGEVNIDIADLIDARKSVMVKKSFNDKASKILLRHFPSLKQESLNVLSAYLMQYTLGLGDLEPFLHDEKLEEIVVNGSNSSVWVYHRDYGWCTTNVRIGDEKAIGDYASAIGRRVGRQINLLNPLMDARLATGDRVNSTLFPISTNGNTITIRKFSRNPWTPPRFIKSGTISAEVMALLWLGISNEMSILVSGGTGSGKTSFLNGLSNLFPPNQRVISIEDTREINLPSFLQWVPLSTRLANPEGKGQVEMLDLLVNSLRMRPDRIVVGEVRRKREAEILFEAMHTGHSVYATLHADNTDQTISRMTNPPIDVKQTVIGALDLIVVQYRNRRTGVRKTFEVAEVDDMGNAKVIYRWNPKTDKIEKINELDALGKKLALYTGMTIKEINKDISERAKVLTAMADAEIYDIENVGKVVAEYYKDKNKLLEFIDSGGNLNELI